jgi:hypothetical protein
VHAFAAISALAAVVRTWGRPLYPLRAFFKVTGLVLIVFAAGLVARTVMFLQVVAWLAFLVLVTILFLRPAPASASAPRPAVTPTP